MTIDILYNQIRQEEMNINTRSVCQNLCQAEGILGSTGTLRNPLVAKRRRFPKNMLFLVAFHVNFINFSMLYIWVYLISQEKNPLP